MDKIRLNKESFADLLARAKYQFLLKTESDLYFVPLPRGSKFFSETFIGFNERTGSVEIIKYDDVKSVIVDGFECLVNHGKPNLFSWFWTKG
ncbi:MAG: hypothetical protein JW783_15080 [Bacteroidales bacterium]|nr:hypothetical protein [Bacteroidales bacterium]MBN2750316.1 hypothetical protein [Bacteroidales bacterium]